MNKAHPGSYRHYWLRIVAHGSDGRIPSSGEMWVEGRSRPAISLPPFPSTRDDFISWQSDRPTKFEAANHCIYCSHRPNDDLSDEHIIAEGLGGTIVLPNSVCAACRDLTNEGKILSTLLLAARHKLRLKMKKRKRDVSSGFPFLTSTGVSRLPLVTHPTVLVLPILEPPSIIVGRNSHTDSFSALWWKNLNVDIAALAKEGISSFAPISVDALDFCKLIAKIAHSYAFAILRRQWKPMLLDFIRQRFPADAQIPNDMYRLIGGSLHVGDDSPSLHELRLSFFGLGGQRYALISIRLFASLGSPVYHVVAGEIDSNIELRGRGAHKIAFNK